MAYMEESLDMSLGEALPIIQSRILTRATYFGIRTLKFPLDFWVYQEIIFETRPDFIVEIGSYRGGAALALAHICDNVGNGRVVALDIYHGEVPAFVKAHPRITLIEGDACQSFERVKRLVDDASVLVIEDSNHTCGYTLQALRTFSPLVKIGGYFIVEDGICHHGLDEGPNPGPYEAIEEFARTNRDFEIDRSRESFLITWNPKGYLKRIA